MLSNNNVNYNLLSNNNVKTITCCRITMLSIVYCRTLTCLALSPMTTDKTPAGSPAVTHRFANKRAGSGDNGEITTQLPAARAGTTWMYIDINKTFPCVYKGFNLLVSCIWQSFTISLIDNLTFIFIFYLFFFLLMKELVFIIFFLLIFFFSLGSLINGRGMGFSFTFQFHNSHLTM